MDTPTQAVPVPQTIHYFPQGSNESAVSAVSWAAVAAGGMVAAAMSLILLALGSGLGFSSISPWQNAGASAKAIGIATVIWLAVMQFIASGLGGYLAGRLRTRWVGVHTDEVFFRDTAHGFLVWALGTIIAAGFLTSAASSLLGTAATGATALGAAGATAAVAATPAAPGGQNAYLADRLLRPDGVTQTAPSTGSADSAPVRGEIVRIFANGMHDGSLAPADRTYLAQSIASRTGISQADAEKRVDDAVAQVKTSSDEARAAADTARKAAAYTSLWIFISLLIGAFVASCAATLGGRSRDRIAA